MGKPARPLPDSILRQIGSALSMIHGITEAHLPMCHAHGVMQEPALVLIIGLRRGAERESIMPLVSEAIRPAPPIVGHLDIWPVDEVDQMLKMARTSGCELFAANGGPSS